MKKKIFSVVAAVAVVAAAGWSYQQSKQYDGMSELAECLNWPWLMWKR